MLNTLAPDFCGVFEAMPVPYLLLDREMCIVAVNAAYLAATGTVREQIVGRDVFEVFPANPGDPGASGASLFRASLERVIRHKVADTMQIHQYDIPFRGPDGLRFEERYWSPRNTPVLDAAGEVAWILHQAEDVTKFVRTPDISKQMATRIDDQAVEIETSNQRLRELNATLEQRVRARTRAQQEMEERLRANERRFRLMADAIPQIVWIIDGSGHGSYFNRQWADYTGVAPDTMAPDDVIDEFIHPDDRAITAQAWSQASASGDTYVVEHRIRSATGDYRWFLVRADAHTDPDSGETLWFGTSTDVHDRKMAEAAVSAREEMLRLAIDAADVGEWDVDMRPRPCSGRRGSRRCLASRLTGP